MTILLSKGAIQQGDVTPAPPKTVLTPHVSTSPDLASQDDHISSEDEHSTQEMHPLCRQTSVCVCVCAGINYMYIYNVFLLYNLANSAGGENEIR